MGGRGQRKSREYTAFENIDEDAKQRAAPTMARVFTRYASTAAALHILVLALTVVEFLIVPWWTLYIRAILLVRLACLLTVVIGMCGVRAGGANVIALMYGTGVPMKTVRALRPSPLLAAWLILGYVDVGLRVLGVLADVVSAVRPAAGQAAQAGLLRAAIGLAIVFEFHLTLNLVYQQGIRHNTKRVLRIKTQEAHDV